MLSKHFLTDCLCEYSGTILTYSSGKVATVAWDSPTACDTGFNKDSTTCEAIVTTAATTYTLTADCPAAPLYTPLVITTIDSAIYQFAPGSITSWDPILADPFTNDFVKCTVARSVDGLYSAYVPPGAFTDAGGNLNTPSTACRGLTSGVTSAFGDGADAPSITETAAGVALCNIAGPHMVTTDVTAPTITATASDDNWMSTIATGEAANGDRITFKLVLSEPLIKTTAAEGLVLPGGAEADGDVTTGHKCANPVWWGSGLVYYLRCNAIPEGGNIIATVATRTISIAFAVDKFYDLAGTANTAMSAFTIISDNQSPNVITTAATPAPAPLASGDFTNLITTFTFTLADAIMVGTTSTSTSATALVPTAVTQAQYPYTISAPGAWASHHATDGTGIMHTTGSTNCGGGTFTVGAGSNLAPTLACPLAGVDWIVEEIPVATMVVSTRTITLAAQITAPTTIDDAAGGGAGQTFQIIARYQRGTLGTVVSDLVVTLPTNYALPTEALGATGGTTNAATADFYVGWTIETELPTGKGIVVDYDESNKQATIEWETIVTATAATTYTLTAPCTAAPMYTDLVAESVTSNGITVVFRTGFAPTARTTDATGVAAVAAGADRGIHGVDSDANFAIECALMRPANREITAYVPAGQFSDVAGNPNTASDPFIVTQDQTIPVVVITVSDASGNALASGDSTGSRAVIFKIKATEHVRSVGTASGAGLNGMVVGDLTNTCTNPKFWGWKDTYYLRCDWTNGQTASCELAVDKVKDLAANQNAVVAAVTAIFT